MRFYSLNNQNFRVSFKEAVIAGIAPDRGLYFPEKISPLSPAFFQAKDTNDPHQIAFEAIHQFVNEDIPDAINRLRSIYPNIMQLTYDNLRTKTVQNIETTDIANLKTPLNLFEELYYKQNNQNLNDKQIDILQELIQDIWEEK